MLNYDNYINKIINSVLKLDNLSDIDKVKLSNAKEKYINYYNIEYMIKDAERILFKCKDNLLNNIINCYNSNNSIFDDFSIVFNSVDCEFNSDNSIFNALQANNIKIDLNYSYILLESKEETEKQLKNLYDLNIDKYASIIPIYL